MGHLGEEARLFLAFHLSPVAGGWATPLSLQSLTASVRSSRLYHQLHIFWLENLLSGSKQENLTRFPDVDSPALACGRLWGKPAGSFQMPQWLQACGHLVPGAYVGRAVVLAGELQSPGGINPFSQQGPRGQPLGRDLLLARGVLAKGDNSRGRASVHVLEFHSRDRLPLKRHN